MNRLRLALDSYLRRLLRPLLSIRTKLVLAVSVVVLVGLVNLTVIYWGARERATTFRELSLAIERQSILTQVHNSLEEQRRFVRLTATRAGVGPPPNETEKRQFALQVDEVPELLGVLASLADGEELDSALAMQGRAARLAEEWKTFYLGQGTNADAAQVALVASEALSDTLIHASLPAAMDLESRHVERLTNAFATAEETVSLVAWSVFLFSAAVAALLLYLALRTLPGTVGALERGAERLGAGDLTHRIRVRTRDELGAVAARFNAMAERLHQRDEELRQRTSELERAMAAAAVADQARSRFLANTSHELRTPLNAIIGYSEMLLEEAEERAVSDMVPDLEKIRASGRHLLALINDVLDLSRIEAGQARPTPEPVDLDALVAEVAAAVEPLVGAMRNRLELRVASPLGYVSTDPTMLRQILLNLLSNAAKFTEAGTIAVEAAVETDDLGAHTLRLGVADTGVGMTREQLSLLFEPFMQGDATAARSDGGTGLGLTLSRRFVELMGGALRVESEPGFGTSFTIELPVERPSAEVVGAPRPMEAVRLRGPAAPPSQDAGGSILVIDDDPTAREMVERMLSHEGYRVETAANGEEGLRLAKQSRPDVVILDVIMPGADGWAVLTAFKSSPELSAIPVVMLTVLEHRNVAYTLGAADFLTKPTEREALLNSIRRQMRERHDTVLVVEDDRDTRALLRKRLTRGGLVVVEAENGRTALQALREDPPGLVLLDLMMPEIDGFQLIERMGEEAGWRSIPVIVLTARDITEEDRARLRGRVVKVLRKVGLPGEELLTEVRRALDSAVAPGPTPWGGAAAPPTGGVA